VCISFELVRWWFTNGYEEQSIECKFCSTLIHRNLLWQLTFTSEPFTQHHCCFFTLDMVWYFLTMTFRRLSWSLSKWIVFSRFLSASRWKIMTRKKERCFHERRDGFRMWTIRRTIVKCMRMWPHLAQSAYTHTDTQHAEYLKLTRKHTVAC